MDVIILAGGLGTRMREETEYRPKPMVHVGDRPVLWHILKGLSHFGLSEFRIAMGYKSEVIQDFFMNFSLRTRDVRIALGTGQGIEYLDSEVADQWNVSLLQTGLDATTADRVLTVSERVELSDTFMIAYGDGLANVDVAALIRAHQTANRLATVTVVRNQSRFGVVDLSEDGAVVQFREKPVMDNFISIGFILIRKEALEYFLGGESLEEGPLSRLAASGQLAAYIHDGFWEPMDTYREYLHLNELWGRDQAPWKVW